ncbi:MAG: metalloregulator ArsR/SmtB family transcription factor [Erythrobacter sp.]|jgi:DNA-binding transcriptional ArsR family regulator|nr:metalloregulator ArsR/SmtB family transcription factor [Erythrobacter sp.]
MMAEEDLIEALKALAHPLRFRILSSLSAGERNVGEIEQVTGIGQPGLSQQLGVLRKAGLVDTRKDAKLVFYAIAGEQIGAVTAAIAALAPGIALTTDPEPLRTPAPGVANFARMS